MEKITIDSQKCVGCGMCVKDCVGFDIELVEGKAVANGASCILCGHCEAICPSGAVKVNGYQSQGEEFSEQTRLNPQELLDAIKTRRTIRQFTEQEVSPEVIQMIIEAGRLAPTGVNAQGTSFVVLNENKARCEQIAVKKFSRLISIGKKLIPQLKSMNISQNFFFKKAPLVIVVFGKDKVSASLAAQNMAFMAEANGLGVLFSGFFTTCISFSPKIRKLLECKGKTPVTTLVIGHPAVKYRRTVNRKPADVKYL